MTVRTEKIVGGEPILISSDKDLLDLGLVEDLDFVGSEYHDGLINVILKGIREGRIVILAGPSGVGKTKLLLGLVRRLISSNTSIFVSQYNIRHFSGITPSILIIDDYIGDLSTLLGIPENTSAVVTIKSNDPAQFRDLEKENPRIMVVFMDPKHLPRGFLIRFAEALLKNKISPPPRKLVENLASLRNPLIMKWLVEQKRLEYIERLAEAYPIDILQGQLEALINKNFSGLDEKQIALILLSIAVIYKHWSKIFSLNFAIGFIKQLANKAWVPLEDEGDDELEASVIAFIRAISRRIAPMVVPIEQFFDLLSDTILRRQSPATQHSLNVLTEARKLHEEVSRRINYEDVFLETIIGLIDEGDSEIFRDLSLPLKRMVRRTARILEHYKKRRDRPTNISELFGLIEIHLTNLVFIDSIKEQLEFIEQYVDAAEKLARKAGLRELIARILVIAIKEPLSVTINHLMYGQLTDFETKEISNLLPKYVAKKLELQRKYMKKLLELISGTNQQKEYVLEAINIVLHDHYYFRKLQTLDELLESTSLPPALKSFIGSLRRALDCIFFYYDPKKVLKYLEEVYKNKENEHYIVLRYAPTCGSHTLYKALTPNVPAKYLEKYTPIELLDAYNGIFKTSKLILEYLVQNISFLVAIYTQLYREALSKIHRAVIQKAISGSLYFGGYSRLILNYVGAMAALAGVHNKIDFSAKILGLIDEKIKELRDIPPIYRDFNYPKVLRNKASFLILIIKNTKTRQKEKYRRILEQVFRELESMVSINPVAVGEYLKIIWDLIYNNENNVLHPEYSYDDLVELIVEKFSDSIPALVAELGRYIAWDIARYAWAQYNTRSKDADLERLVLEELEFVRVSLKYLYESRFALKLVASILEYTFYFVSDDFKGPAVRLLYDKIIRILLENHRDNPEVLGIATRFFGSNFLTLYNLYGESIIRQLKTITKAVNKIPDGAIKEDLGSRIIVSVIKLYQIDYPLAEQLSKEVMPLIPDSLEGLFKDVLELLKVLSLNDIGTALEILEKLKDYTEQARRRYTIYNILMVSAISALELVTKDVEVYLESWYLESLSLDLWGFERQMRKFLNELLGLIWDIFNMEVYWPRIPPDLSNICYFLFFVRKLAPIFGLGEIRDKFESKYGELCEAY